MSADNPWIEDIMGAAQRIAAILDNIQKKAKLSISALEDIALREQMLVISTMK